jgi:hypothetical protein
LEDPTRPPLQRGGERIKGILGKYAERGTNYELGFLGFSGFIGFANPEKPKKPINPIYAVLHIALW